LKSTILILILSFSFSTCKNAEESNTKSKIDIVGDDDSIQTIDVSVKGDETYLPAKLRDLIGKASHSALKDPNFGVQGLLGFSPQQFVTELQSGVISPSQYAKQLWVRENDDDARLLYYIQKTKNGLLKQSGGMFRGDIFGEGNFRRRVWFGNEENRREPGITPITSLSRLMNWQPWFEWNPNAQSFTARTTGAPSQILKHLKAISGGNNEIVLYRGANSTESKHDYRPSAVDPYSEPLSNSRLIFTTTSKEAALRFASPYLLKASFTFEKLRELAEGKKPSLYIGIEFDYPEFAFLVTQSSTNIWFDTSTVECTNEPIKDYKLCSNK
jgi:hypothetical protein